MVWCKIRIPLLEVISICHVLTVLFVRVQLYTVSHPVRGESNPPMQQVMDAPTVEADPAKIAAQLFNASFAPDPNKLGIHQLVAFAAVTRAYNLGEGIHSAHVLGNASALNTATFPTGQVINFRPEAQVDTMSLSKESLAILVLNKIIAANGQTLTDDFFKAKLSALDEAAPQYAAAPISTEIRNEIENTDDALWTPELGDSGSVGVVVRRTGASSDYYIQANCTAPVLAQEVISELNRRNEAGNPTTWKAFVESSEFAYWKQGVIRQAR